VSSAVLRVLMKTAASLKLIRNQQKLKPELELKTEAWTTAISLGEILSLETNWLHSTQYTISTP